MSFEISFHLNFEQITEYIKRVKVGSTLVAEAWAIRVNIVVLLLPRGGKWAG